MSTRFVPEPLSSLSHDARRSAGQSADQEHHALGSLVVEDINVASRSAARLLITASTQQAVETLARHIHANSRRAQSPLVMTPAGELPAGAQALSDGCLRLLDAADGGSLLLNAVDEMPVAVQESLIDVLAALESARGPSAAVRLIAGTTVSLVDRIAAGAFSQRLFYRLNTIHVMAGAGPAESPSLKSS